MRVHRARDLGLDDTTYAGIRSATGRDVVASLFSSNALAVPPSDPRIGPVEAARLARLCEVGRLVPVHPPHAPDAVAAANPVLDQAAAAPRLTDIWAATRDRLAAVLRNAALPLAGVVVVGATALERARCPAARAAAYLEAERYFAT